MEHSEKSPQQYYQTVHSGLAACVASKYTDAEALTDVVEALDGWLSDYPAQSRDVERICVSACYSAAQFRRPDAVARVGEQGLVASLISPHATPRDHAATVLLMLFNAEAQTANGNFREAQAALDDARSRLERRVDVGQFAPYLTMRLAYLDASLAEEALETVVAAPLYAEAVKIAQPILGNQALLKALAQQWADLVFGAGVDRFEDGATMVTTLFRSEVVNTLVIANVRFARATDTRDSARIAIAACITHGLPARMSPVELRPVLLRLTPDDFERYSVALLDRAKERYEKSGSGAWQIIVLLAKARVEARDGSTDSLPETFERVSALAPSVHDAATWAAALSDTVELRESGAERAFEFLRAYGTTIDGPRGARLPLRLRPQFDEQLSRAVILAANEYETSPNNTTGSRLAVLLDALQAPDAQAIGFVAKGAFGTDEDEYPEYSARYVETYETALNRIGRLQHSMTIRDQACALLMQTSGDRVRFFPATGDPDRPFLQAEAGPDYLAAANALSSALSDAISDPSADTTASFAELGGAAFRAIPDSITEILRDCTTIYVVPDYWASKTRLPFELLHDGSDFLGLSTVIARALSIAHLIRTVEEPVFRLKAEQRAVALAAPIAPGERDLEYAETEVAIVADRLRQTEWEVPSISADRLSATSLLDAMEHARITHIAAHGKVAAGGEALILGPDCQLTAADIEQRPRSFGGLMFLNACSLGRSRYLGGGINRGIASSLLQAGAPSVVANLLPVEDQSAMELAKSFYDELDAFSTGEALRRARRALADTHPPSRWATTVLIGDPEFTPYDVRGQERQSEVAARLLRQAASVPTDTESIPTSLEQVDESDTRLVGAASWMTLAHELGESDPIDWHLDAARVAGALDSRPGEAFFLFSAATATDDPDLRRERLSAAIYALEPLARTENFWSRLHLEVLAERKTLDARGTLKPVDTGRMIVNDMADPAVQAMLQAQNAVDQLSLQEAGILRLKHPERTLRDVAWNAVVIGQQNRFHSRDSQAGYASQMAEKLAALSLIERTAIDGVARVAAGMLSFLWEAQRVTHLEPERAEGQANALAIALQSFTKQTPDEILNLMGPIVECIGTQSESRSSNRFSAALEALATDNAPEDAPLAVAARIRTGLGECGQDSVEMRAGAAAWAIGSTLVEAYRARRRSPPDEAHRRRCLQIFDALYSDMEGWFFPYLMEGYKPVRERNFDFVQRWRWTKHT